MFSESEQELLPNEEWRSFANYLRDNPANQDMQSL